jgi:hypothetical protein
LKNTLTTYLSPYIKDDFWTIAKDFADKGDKQGMFELVNSYYALKENLETITDRLTSI